MKYGFVQSKLDGTEQKLEVNNGVKLPESYSYEKILPKVLDQGNDPICVPCSISSFIEWKYNMNSGSVNDNKVEMKPMFKKYGSRDGMTFKEGLHYLHHEGISTNKGVFKIDQYAMVGSIQALKQAIVLNGPCIGGLPVKDSKRADFWKGFGNEGGHAVAIVGYDKDGFLIRNSWGKSYGYDGYMHLPYEDFNRFYEIWALIKN